MQNTENPEGIMGETEPIPLISIGAKQVRNILSSNILKSTKKNVAVDGESIIFRELQRDRSDLRSSIFEPRGLHPLGLAVFRTP